MQIEFSKEEAVAIAKLLARVDIKGAEAPVVVALFDKFKPLLEDAMKEGQPYADGGQG